MLLGEFEVQADDRGRVFVPAKLKSCLSDGKFVMTRMPGCPCIQIVGESDFESMQKRLFSKARYSLDPNTASLQRCLISSCAPLEIASYDKFLIPQGLREYARINGKATLVLLGLVDRVEIWEKEEYRKYNSDNMDKIAAEAAKFFGETNETEE